MTDTLFDLCGTLPNGQCIKSGDVVKYSLGPYTGFNKVIEECGVLCLKENFMYGTVSCSHFISQGNQLEKVTPKDVYQFCKKQNWPTYNYLMLFK